MCSGCIYHQHALTPLLNTIKVVSDIHTIIYLAIDYRFDVTNRNTETFQTPVISEFFKLAQGLLEIKEIKREEYNENFNKHSVVLYECRIFPGK